jgi:hypothetical protein
VLTTESVAKSPDQIGERIARIADRDVAATSSTARRAIPEDSTTSSSVPALPAEMSPSLHSGE